MSKEGREFDLIIYGATGFTGTLAAKYTARQYGKSGDVKWAVAGRSQAKLNALAKECGALGGGAALAPGVVVADAGDAAALAALCGRTKVVASCAGPFARYGKLLVAECVRAGTDYCDITGELGFVREMIARYDGAACGSGSRVVHLCGHDSVPWDLSTLLLHKEIKRKNPNAQLARVDFFTDIRSAPSGGTLETALGIMFGAEGRAKPHPAVRNLGFDPLLLQRAGDGGGKSAHGTSARNVATLQLGAPPVLRRGNAAAAAAGRQVAVAKPHRALFFMAGVNANAVKRSNALNRYGDKVVYCEGAAFGSMLGALAYLVQLAALGLLLALPPTRYLMRKFVLPSPGQGPSEASMRKGYLIVTGCAAGTDQGETTATSVMRFPVDPGYMDTARMVVEAALTLALDSHKLDNQAGGVFTPAACQGTALLDRLVATGTSFEIQ